MNILVAMETKPYQRVWLEEAAPGETFIYKEGKAEREGAQQRRELNLHPEHLL